MASPPVDFRLLAGAGVAALDFKGGDIIFRESDPARELFIIQSGEVEIRLGNRVLETLPQFSIFGEMGLDRQRAAQRDGGCGERRQARSGGAKSSFCF